MTTTAARNAIHAQIADDIRRCSEALAHTAQSNDWRMDALERAADLARAGLWAESREAAAKGRE